MTSSDRAAGYGVPSLFSTDRLNQRRDRGVWCATHRSRTHPGQRVPVNFSYLVQDADRVSVYPASASLPVTSVVQLRPQLQVFGFVGFVLDTHLGRLVTYLRMLDFDVVYQDRCDDEELAHTSAVEHRILLTRDRGLLKRGEVIWGLFVRATEPRAQLLEVLRRFNLFHLAEPFRRCLRCNSLLQQVPKESIHDRLPPRT